MSEIIIQFTSPSEITLKLLEHGVVTDASRIEVDFNLDSYLPLAIDKILRKNKIESSALKKASVEGEERLNSTSYRVAQAVVAAINT
ncbi:MAG TPA: hypothetical protein VJJ72_01835 [Candidatus Paceibacterota bacterium]